VTRIRDCEITVVQGDITVQSTEAIVNAANPTLLGGGGVDGAIHARAGPELLEECRELRRTTWPSGLPTGEAVLTRGGRLPARFVIHTVGPVWRGGGEGEGALLRHAYINSLTLAERRGLGSISFPSISTGAYGYPMRDASRVAIRAVADYLGTRDPGASDRPPRSLREVRFVLFSPSDRREFETVLHELRPSLPADE